MSKKEQKIEKKKEPTKAEIKKICQDIVLVGQLEEQRNQLEIELMNARQQIGIWQQKASQLEGGIATLNLALEKKVTPKTLIMDNQHEIKDKKDESGS